MNEERVFSFVFGFDDGRDNGTDLGFGQAKRFGLENPNAILVRISRFERGTNDLRVNG